MPNIDSETMQSLVALLLGVMERLRPDAFCKGKDGGAE